MGLMNKLFRKGRQGFVPSSSAGELGGALRILRGHAPGVSAVGFALGSRVLFSADTEGNFAAWTSPSFEPHLGLSHDPKSATMDIATTLGECVYLARGSFVEHWTLSPDFLDNAHAFKSVALSGAHPSGVTRVIATTRGPISGGAEGNVVFWEEARRKPGAVGHVEGAILAIACSPTAAYEAESGARLAVGTSLGTVTVLEADDRTIVYTAQLHASEVRSLSIQNHRFQHRHILASACPSEHSVCIWDKNLKLTQVTARAHVVAFSPDGRFLAHGDHNDIVIRDGRNWTERERLRGHRGTVSTLAFSPMQYPDDLWDGWLASGANDGTVRVWKVAD